MSISYNYFSTAIWKDVVFWQGAPRRCRSVKAFFPDSAAPLHHYHCITVIHRKKYILFRSIVFRIKNFYKHVDINPSVRLLHLLVTLWMPRWQVLWGSRRGRVCYLIAIPSCSNESNLNKNKECFDFVTLYNISYTNFPCSPQKKDILKLKEKKEGGGGGTLHFVNIHHGQINITQCMHTYGRYNVHCPIILVLKGNFT